MHMRKQKIHFKKSLKNFWKEIIKWWWHCTTTTQPRYGLDPWLGLTNQLKTAKVMDRELDMDYEYLGSNPSSCPETHY